MPQSGPANSANKTRLPEAESTLYALAYNCILTVTETAEIKLREAQQEQ
ncbi:hypothetical protein ACMA1I_16300 [Pontibacter sp. 13R65]